MWQWKVSVVLVEGECGGGGRRVWWWWRVSVAVEGECGSVG